MTGNDSDFRYRPGAIQTLESESKNDSYSDSSESCNWNNVWFILMESFGIVMSGIVNRDGA